MPKEKPRKRVKIKGHYMQVRQRSTKKGKKGTIIAKWKSEKKGKIEHIDACSRQPPDHRNTVDTKKQAHNA